GEVVRVLQDREPGHQPRRQRRAPRNVGVDRPEARLQKAPIDGPRELRQRMAHVDDLIEPRPKQILLPAVSALLRPHRESPPFDIDKGRESRRERRIYFARKRRQTQAELAKTITAPKPKPMLRQRFASSSRETN